MNPGVLTGARIFLRRIQLAFLWAGLGGGCVLLGGKTRPAAPLHVFRQLAHGFPGDFDTLAAGSRGLRDIDGRKNFAAAAFTFLPQRQGLLCRIFGAVDAARLDGVAQNGEGRFTAPPPSSR